MDDEMANRSLGFFKYIGSFIKFRIFGLKSKSEIEFKLSADGQSDKNNQGEKMKIVSQKLGAEGQLDIDLASGVLSVVATEQTAGVQISLSASAPLVYYVDAAAQKANSPLLSAVAAILDGALKAIA